MEHKPNLVEENYIIIPRNVMRLHKHAVVVADVMFVNNIVFLINLSRKI